MTQVSAEIFRIHMAACVMAHVAFPAVITLLDLIVYNVTGSIPLCVGQWISEKQQPSSGETGGSFVC